MESTINKWDKRFLSMAELISTWSKDPSTRTGAVIVRPDNKTIISLGFNGFPRYMSDDIGLYGDREEKYSRIIHCEINALISAAQPVNHCMLFTWPFLSCDRCMVVMLQAGIRRFVAPKPSSDIDSRWSDSLLRSRRYAFEMGAHILEYSMDELILEGK